MAAFSGFYKSPGPPPLVDARGIAPLHCHGHRNGPQRRYIRSPPPPILIDQNIGKRPCYGPFKLTLSNDINQIGFISLCVSYWLPPMQVLYLKARWFFTHIKREDTSPHPIPPHAPRPCISLLNYPHPCTPTSSWLLSPPFNVGLLRPTHHSSSLFFDEALCRHAKNTTTNNGTANSDSRRLLRSSMAPWDVGAAGWFMETGERGQSRLRPGGVHCFNGCGVVGGGCGLWEEHCYVSSSLVKGQKQSGIQNCRSSYSGIVCPLCQYQVLQALVVCVPHRMKTSWWGHGGHQRKKYWRTAGVSAHLFDATAN